MTEGRKPDYGREKPREGISIRLDAKTHAALDQAKSMLGQPQTTKVIECMLLAHMKELGIKQPGTLNPDVPRKQTRD